MNMRKLFLLAILFVYSLPSYAEKKVFTVGVYSNKPLIFSHNNKADGFFIDIIKDVAKKNGFSLKFVIGTWPELFDKTKTGKIDILPCVAYSKERANYFIYNKKTIFVNWSILYTYKTNKINNLFELHQKKIGLQKKDIHAKAFKNLMQEFNIQFTPVYFNKYDEIMNALQRKAIDAGVVNKIYGSFYKNENIIPTSIMFNPVQLKFVTSKQENIPLLNKIDEWIEINKKNKHSIYYQFYNKWFFEEQRNKILKALYYAILGLSLSLLLGYSFLHQIIKSRTKELENAKESLNAIFENMKDAIFIHDIKGQIIDINDGMLQMYEVDKKEAKNYNIRDFSCDDMDFSRAEKFWEEILNGKSVPPIEWKAKKPRSGECFPVEVNLTKIEYFGKECILAVVRDISDRKELLSSLKTEKLRFEEYINLVQVMVVALNKEGRISYINKKGAEILGYSQEELIGIDWFSHFIPPEQREEIKNVFKQIIGGNLNLVEFYENYIQDKYGNKKLISWHNTILYNEKGEIDTVLSSGLDITKEKEFLNKLLFEKTKLNTMLESIGEGIIGIDKNKKIMFFNKTAKEILGVRKLDLLGVNFEELLSRANPNINLSNILEIVEKERKYSSEIQFNRNNKKLTIEFTATTLKSEDEQLSGYIVVFRDITKEKLIETEMLRIEKLKSLSYLAAGIAHDFNNLLTGIINNLYLIREHIQKNEQEKAFEILENLNMILNQTKGLTKQLLTFAKGGEPILKSASIGELIKQTAEFLVRGSKIKLELKCSENLPFVKMDKDQMSQVIQNLIVNAIDVMRTGGTLIIKCEEVFISEEDKIPLPNGNYVHISITDTGTGIRKEHLDKIFDPFFTTKKTGNGLGLAIAHSIILKHNGFITVESSMGEGTTFHIYLPAEQQKDTQEEGKNMERLEGNNQKILIMDDEEFIRDSFKMILETFGFHVILAKNGDEALKKAEEEKPDFAFLDVTIPGGKGAIEIIDEFKSISRKTTTIVMSGYSGDITISKFKEYGFNYVLPKPFDIKDIQQIIMKANKERTEEG